MRARRDICRHRKLRHFLVQALFGLYLGVGPALVFAQGGPDKPRKEMTEEDWLLKESQGVPEWGLGPFVRVPENPVLKPRPESVFWCPIKKEIVHWESRNVVATAAVVKNEQLYLLYRAEPVNCNNSRVGMGMSTDGVNFRRLPYPIYYPDNDAQKGYEWPGGTEDGRIVQREDGVYIYIYPAYNMVARQFVATSRDLIFWTKHGSAYAKAYGGKYLNQWTKAGSIVSRYYDDGRVVAQKIKGKYWMYGLNRTGGNKCFVAYSDDCIHWTPVETNDGKLRNILPVRRGKFDTFLTEPGPPAVVTPKGILLIYTGYNKRKTGDPVVLNNAYSGGQALFDLNDPAKLIARCDDYFITPRMTYETESAIGFPVTFLESMVRWKGKWFLYYGGGDKVVCAATCDMPGFEK